MGIDGTKCETLKFRVKFFAVFLWPFEVTVIQGVKQLRTGRGQATPLLRGIVFEGSEVRVGSGLGRP